jgi:hypothetical protein
MFLPVIKLYLCFSLFLSASSFASVKIMKSDEFPDIHLSKIARLNAHEVQEVNTAPTYCEQTLEEIITSRNLRKIYSAAGFFMDMSDFSSAQQLYNSALSLEQDSGQMYVTKSHLGLCLLNSPSEEDWKNGAQYFIEGSKGYDVAYAFLSDIVPGFSKSTEEESIRKIVDTKRRFADQGPWTMEG